MFLVIAVHTWHDITSPDVQGFPLADVDHYKVRQLRQEHIMLTNDVIKLTSDLHAALTAVHESARNSNTVSEGAPRDVAMHDAEPAATCAGTGLAQGGSGAAVARVTHVEEGSPADAAGLHVGDTITRFGDVPAGQGAVQAIAARLAVRPHTLRAWHCPLMRLTAMNRLVRASC